MAVQNEFLQCARSGYTSGGERFGQGFALSQTPRSGIVVINADTKKVSFPASVRVIEYEGVEDDRYRIGKNGVGRGHYSGNANYEDDIPRATTFITRKGIAQGNARLDEQRALAPLMPEDLARNFVLEDIEPEELNGLVGMKFRFGGLLFLGMDLARPCARPSQRKDLRLGKPDRLGKAASEKDIWIARAFQGLSGIRAVPLESGEIVKSTAVLNMQTVFEAV